MGFLTQIEAVEGAPGRVEVRVQAGRTLLVLGLSVAALAAAAALHGLDRETAAAWFTGAGEALLFATFGLVVGETTGAKETEAKLSR